MWVSNSTIPVPDEDDSRVVLLQVIDDTNEEHAPYTRPQSRPLQLQWTGFRKGASQDTPEPEISEVEKYQRLLQDTENRTVILYVYGGAY